MEKLKFDICHTKWGYVAMAASKAGVRHLILPAASKSEAFDALCGQLRGEELLPDNAHPWLLKLGAALKLYFQGHQVDFTCKLDYNVATVFQREVWGITRTIAYGRTQTYGWIAGKTGKPEAARAVGQALHANHLPLLIPCHRVLASHNKIGGYAYGAETKSRLLKLEGAILA